MDDLKMEPPAGTPHKFDVKMVSALNDAISSVRLSASPSTKNNRCQKGAL